MEQNKSTELYNLGKKKVDRCVTVLLLTEIILSQFSLGGRG